MKLFAREECSEKLATLIPYCALLARIQSAAAMTSLVRAMPWSSMTSIETSFAVGAAPSLPASLPAAMPATNVPCPRPSPGELPGSVDRLTLATIRPANSGRVVSIPESTIAIVAAGAPLYLSTPVTYGHFSLLSMEPEAAESRTRASGVTALTCLSLASASTCAPLSWTAIASIERKSL